MNVAVIGCGLIGRKRAQVFSVFHDDRLKVVCDTDQHRAESVAKDSGCEFQTQWNDVVHRSDIDIVIVSTTNDYLAQITRESLKAGKHVLCEKPLGRNVGEAREIQSIASAQHVFLKTGFNHRFHPAIFKAKEYFDKGTIGKCLTIRARYGHGGRPGMELEWRSIKDVSGGGELLDQGVHIIDLIRWFGGDVTEVYGKIETKFWDISVEDNAFGILKTVQDVTATFHVSWTNWRNVFSLEVFGDKGYIAINGMGGSYGTETLELGIRNPQGGKPDITSMDFPGDDQSWLTEWREFRTAIVQGRQPIGNGNDGLQANIVIEALYESSRRRGVVYIP